MAFKTSSESSPYIYCYSTPGISYHDGWVKIGYTEQGVEKRITQQTKTAGIRYQIEWKESATYIDHPDISFKDDEFKSYLLSKGVNNQNPFGEEGSVGDEWYEIAPDTAKRYFDEFRKSPSADKVVKAYRLRKEQEAAVTAAETALKNKKETEFLWNAKPRFGKCLSCYDFCKNISAKRVLIVTNRPAVATSWCDDYEKYMGRESRYFFVSRVEEIKTRKTVISYESYLKDKESRKDSPDAIEMGIIYFASLQDIKSSVYFGGAYPKLRELTTIDWDVLVVDESHEGVETYRTEEAFNRIKRNFTLYLSGTPFRAIKDEKFDADSIYNWTYVSEQEAKMGWNGEGTNPYMQMPKMSMLTYRLSNIIGGKVDFSDEEESVASDRLNSFFKVTNGRFVNDEKIDRFLDVISSDEKYPFGTEESRSELAHTFWLLLRVDSVKALAVKLRQHPVFGKYEIIVAAGDGKADESDESGKSYTKVMEAVTKYPRTITLSVKQLTTGVTIPQWSGVMMLSERNSAAEYMQASFRAQNPYVFCKKDSRTGRFEHIRKTQSYVFDFNPEHTLDIVEQFANNLYSETANGRGDYEERRKNIEKLLQYMPVVGENDDGEMCLLDSDQVLLIPRKMRSQEVVRRGFMCDALFQNITNVFHLTGNDIVNKLPIVRSKTVELSISEQERRDMHLNEDGDIEIKEEEIKEEVQKIISSEEKQKEVRKASDAISQTEIHPALKGKEREKEREKFVSEFVEAAQIGVARMREEDLLTDATEKIVRREIAKEAGDIARHIYGNFIIESQSTEADMRDMLSADATEEEKEEKEKEIAREKDLIAERFKEEAVRSVEDFVENRTFDVGAVTVMEEKANKIKNEKIDVFKKHLKGFTRTIPSFLMAYGCDDFTLQNLDDKIPSDVFEDVTSITLDEFKVLRDECKYFEPTVFNDAVREFLRYRRELSDYFREDSHIVLDGVTIEDIFDLIPPQRTNQIYTPKSVIREMVDYLEQENPRCFEDDNATFIDLYMKSGLYIAEIVRRLYNNEKMQRKYQGEEERLRVIFGRIVYGLAPSEIIYRIATNYVIGFAEERGMDIPKDHFVMCDALEEVKNGDLKEKLEELFGENT